jgi:4-hydroxy-3-methylbut-2-enyl diphosphate reductase
VFVDSVEEVPEGERVIYSAHGVSPEVREASERRRLRVIDATCPLVTKVHVEAVRFAKDGYSIILIGHRDHDEVIGTLGEAPAVTQVISSPEEVEQLTVPDPERVAYTTQTTLSLEETKDVIAALRKRFPKIYGPAAQDICYATENRQVAVKQVAGGADLLLVVGSDNSSNSNRLVEVARKQGTPAYLIENYRAIHPEWLDGIQTVALTAGASAPECLVQEAVSFLTQSGFNNLEEVEVMPENVRFGLPPEIVEAISPATAAAE